MATADNELEPASSFRFLDTTKERRDMWWLKRRGLPFMHGNLLLKGRA